MQPIIPTDCFYYLISRATLTATSVIKRELAAAGVEQVSPAYLGVLMTLWNADGLGALELGRGAGVEPSTVTGLLDRMERDGLLARQPDPDDRRAQRICLTELGQRLRQPVLSVVDEVLGRATSGFSEQELSTSKNFLRQFLANMQEERRGTHGQQG
ncbi:MAG: MarR family transcriptional regulator [Deltaproteobacteria bacterium]|nr:MarR family transcriptional regulator [Deltaproteobacteria bacterium]